MGRNRILPPCRSGFVLAAAAGLLAACSGVTPCGARDSSTGPLYRYGLGGVEEAVAPTAERVAGGFAVRLRVEPSPAGARDQVRISFFIEDRSQFPPKPVTGARVACRMGMWRGEGHIHDLGTHEDHAEATPGRYDMPPMVFGMGGRWDVVFQALLPDGRQFYGVYPVMVDGPPWPQSPKSVSHLRPMGTVYGR